MGFAGFQFTEYIYSIDSIKIYHNLMIIHVMLYLYNKLYINHLYFMNIYSRLFLKMFIKYAIYGILYKQLSYTMILIIKLYKIYISLKGFYNFLRH